MPCLCVTIMWHETKNKKRGTQFTSLTISERLHHTLFLCVTTERKGIYFKKEIWMFAKSCYKHNLKFRTNYKIRSSTCFAWTAQNRVTDLKFKWTSEKVYLPHNYTQVYLLVSTFIIVFPFKFIWDKKENKDNGPGWNAQFVWVYSTESLLFMGIVLLVSAISEGKGLALLKFWGGAGRPR